MTSSFLSSRAGVAALLLALVSSASALSVTACDAAGVGDVGTQSSEVRSMTPAEALADFDQLAESFRGLYGALERKEARYHFRFDDLVADYRARVAVASGDVAYQGIFQEFVARFRDAHVSLSAPLLADDAHVLRLPVAAMPVGDTFVVYLAGPAAGSEVRVGDELLAIDGVPARDLAARFRRFAGTPNERAAAHFAAARFTVRPSHLSPGLAAGDVAVLRIRGADGAERDVRLAWSETPRLLPPRPAIPRVGTSGPRTIAAQSTTAAEITRAELAKMGDRVPFFMTSAVSSGLGLTPVKPSPEALARFGVTPEAAAAVDYFAGTYELEGNDGSPRKRILFVRLPSYTPDDEEAALGYLRALFTEQEPLVDGLVFDQTHNPGGSLFFAFGVAQLLAPHPIRALVQANHADRMWIQNFATIANDIQSQEPGHPLIRVMRDQAHAVDEAYSSGKPLSPPLPIFSDVPELSPDPAHFSKPFVMLVDELAVSCGDIVPLLVKENRLGTLFGQRTMGGGGNVEEVATLTNSRWVLNLSRGLGMVADAKGGFPEANVIEDNGVVPDVTFDHTLADVRAGYVGYVDAFNRVLLSRLR